MRSILETAALTSALLLLLLTSPAFAADGVLEINQTCATAAGGCFPGDAAGFPVTINQPGSYQLTGNITVPSDVIAIQIDSQWVTLDLGGFLVSGPTVCTGYPTTSCSGSNGRGINSGQALVVVRNGSVAGMGSYGISLMGPSSEVDHVRVVGCALDGIDVGPAGRVSHSFSGNNGSRGIFIGDGGEAVDNEARANANNGIEINQSSRLSSRAVGNRSFDNTSIGILVGPEVLLSKNVSSDNSSGLQIVGGKSVGDNLCTGTLC